MAQQAREGLTRLINAQPDDIVFTSNTTHGLNIVAQGIDWQPGDNCVVPAGDFPWRTPGLPAHPWRGGAVCAVGGRRPSGVDPHGGCGWPHLGRSVAARSSGIRGIVWTWKHSGNAVRRATCCWWWTPFKPWEHSDWMCAPHALRRWRRGYKWLMAGFGVGALYAAPEALDRIRPTFVGAQAGAEREPSRAWSCDLAPPCAALRRWWAHPRAHRAGR